ncbi:MerR-like helix-turn-helix DNA binding domain protein [Mycobacterium phage Chris]|uniref:MerR-like helix-turn-helix DNA binding domain protein n=1 Tax=Mycobacterium phage Chris TaxID=2725626 RepID=A0A6M3TAI5_9CAUD|nr:MerR-like helix-turn-helix DNA binding domain protein [Mycobacterium phage Chris]QJD50454.1 MerR-like helix-turn-helix DNA binding domain protein [Mycobacterium phage Chris]
MSRSTEAATLAARRARKREERSRIAANTGVLDMFRPRVGKTATTDEVCRLLRVDYGIVLRHVLNRHRDELAADGWDSAAGTFTRRSIIRLALLLRASTSPRAARIAKAARAGSKVISFDHAPRSQHCANVLDGAFALAEKIRDDDPGEVWASLNRLDRHGLTALTVALAAMVDVDSAGATRWLRSLSGGRGGPEGLQHLVPTRETTDGLPLSVLDQIEADDEADQDDESENA